MAEVDFEDENLDEDDDDLLFDDEEVEGDLDDLGDAAATDAGFFTRRRLIIIGAILGTVFLVSAVLFGVRMMGGDDEASQQSQLRGSKDAPTLQSNTQSRKKKNKKKIKYTKLYDLERNSITDVLRELSYSNITFKSEQRGKTFTIMVDEDEVSEALNILALKGLPSSDKEGYALLDDASTLGVTEFDKKIRYVRALSGELEKAIIQLVAIDDAKVQVVLPKERFFTVTQPPVTASVLIRKRQGFKMTDDLVFGIIQLISNAVENLQQENVSVIDTNGMVLSNGIFARMAARVDIVEEDTRADVDKVAPPSPLLGKPIIPNFDDIQQWYQVKSEYETDLEKKVIKQLKGVLPSGSYKVALSAELGPLNSEDVVDVKLITTSIVVDSSRDDIFMTPDLKQQIFNTIAGTIGYVRGRDSIQLNLADFKTLTEAERREIAGEGSSGFLAILLNLVYLGLAGAAGFVGWRWFKKRNKGDADILSEEENEPAKFDELQGEIQAEKNWDDIRAMAQSEPENLAAIMEEWLSKEREEVPA